MFSFRIRALLLGALLVLLAPALPARAQEAAVPGFRVQAHERLADGLEHLTLLREKPPLAVHVARISPLAEVSLRPVLSNEVVAGPEPRKERTSSMCVRVRCLAAVNGDFSVIETGEPLGGLVIGGEIIRSPNASHHQLIISSDGIPASGPMGWTGTLMPTDLRPISLNGVNVSRQENQVVLYTHAYGPSTGTNQYGSELLARVVEPVGPIVVDQTARVTFSDFREARGDAVIPSQGLVFSGHGSGAEALKSLWLAMQSGQVAKDSLLRIETNPPATDSVGGTPILVRDGKRWFANEPTSLVRDRHPRTLAGWNSAGTVWLVTVDGRQPGYSVGMTLAESADFMIALGATESINLDGGGSTTFVVKGEVVNRPSDRAVRRGSQEMIVAIPGARDRVLGNVERPRPVALAIVLATSARLNDQRAVGDIELPNSKPLNLPFPSAIDPGSNATLAMPAIINPEPSPDHALLLVGVSANALTALLLAAYWAKRVRAWR